MYEYLLDTLDRSTGPRTVKQAHIWTLDNLWEVAHSSDADMAWMPFGHAASEGRLEKNTGSPNLVRLSQLR